MTAATQPSSGSYSSSWLHTKQPNWDCSSEALTVVGQLAPYELQVFNLMNGTKSLTIWHQAEVVLMNVCMLLCLVQASNWASFL